MWDSGTVIFYTTCALRDAIAAEAHNKTKAILVPLNVYKAFESISYKYLFQVLRWHGFSETFVSYIQSLYTNIPAVLQIIWVSYH